MSEFYVYIRHTLTSKVFIGPRNNRLDFDLKSGLRSLILTEVCILWLNVQLFNKIGDS